MTPSTADARVQALEMNGWVVDYVGANANFWFVVAVCQP